MNFSQKIYVSDKDTFIGPVLELYKEEAVDKTLRIEIKNPTSEEVYIEIMFSHVEMNIIEYNQKEGIVKIELSEPVLIEILDKIFNHYIPIIHIQN
jgi:hypothetical protein